MEQHLGPDHTVSIIAKLRVLALKLQDSDRVMRANNVRQCDLYSAPVFRLVLCKCALSLLGVHSSGEEGHKETEPS